MLITENVERKEKQKERKARKRNEEMKKGRE